MADDNKARSVYDITFVITMDIAFKMLRDGVLTLEEFRRYFDEMSRKYDTEEVRILYQTKLDNYLEESANSDTKGALANGDH